MKRLIIGFLLVGPLLSANLPKETRKVIAVIDTGFYIYQKDLAYMCKGDHLSTFLTAPYYPRKDYDGTMKTHGPNVIGLIGSKIDSKKYCIRSIRVVNGNKFNYDSGLNMLLNMKNLVGVNISMGGSEYYESEYKIIKKLTDKGVKVNVAIGNDSTRFTKKNCQYFPACLKLKPDINNNLTVVAAKDTGSSNSTKAFKVQYRPGKDQGYPILTGTSQSTANYTGEMFSK